MARILAAMVALLFLLPAFGRTKDHPAGLAKTDWAAIQHVIAAQLSALQHDDAALAFSYASPFIQKKFGTPEKFLDMVKTGYPTVYRPRDVQFRELETTEEGPVQKVFFFAPDRDPVIGRYLMQKQPNGSWKINGCKLTPAPDLDI